MLKIVSLLSMQHFEERAGKCDTIPLLSGIESVWHPSKIKFLQSQLVAQNAQARGFRNSEVSSKTLTGREQSLG
jgi:hypothetical protein